jgi:hypothetical protein
MKIIILKHHNNPLNQCTIFCLTIVVENFQNINIFVKTEIMNLFKVHLLSKLIFVLIKRKDGGRFSKH